MKLNEIHLESKTVMISPKGLISLFLLMQVHMQRLFIIVA